MSACDGTEVYDELTERELALVQIESVASSLEHMTGDVPGMGRWVADHATKLKKAVAVLKK